MCAGNHDLCAMSRRTFFDEFLSPLCDDSQATFPSTNNFDNPSLYFDYVCPHPEGRESSGLRLIFIDGYEFSSFGAISEDYAKEADLLLKSKNKNLSCDPQGDWYVGLKEEVF